MAHDYRISISVLLGAAIVVYTVSLLPALTSGGNESATGVSKVEFDAAVRQELDYCQRLPDAINCQCFAEKAGIILTHNKPKVPTAIYADKQQLARGQAARSC